MLLKSDIGDLTFEKCIGIKQAKAMFRTALSTGPRKIVGAVASDL